MRKRLSALRPYAVGSLAAAVFTVFSVLVSYIAQNNGVTYFICGVTGAFGIGYAIYRLAGPVSPLTALVLIPCMFSGVFIGEYLHLMRERVIAARPSELKAHASSDVFELRNHRIVREMKSSYSGTWRYKDKSATIHVYAVPVVDEGWGPGESVEVFAVCEKTFGNSGSCDGAFHPGKRFAKRIVRQTSDHYKSFEVSVKRGVKDHDLHVAGSIVFVELISDISVYAARKRNFGIMLCAGLVLLWNAVSFWSVRYESKRARRSDNNVAPPSPGGA